MKRIKERLLSLLLTVCMSVSLMPALTVGAAAWSASSFESFSSSGTKTVTSGNPAAFTTNSSGAYNILSSGNTSSGPIFVAKMEPSAGSGTYTYNVVITGSTTATVDGYSYYAGKTGGFENVNGLEGNILIIGDEKQNPVTVNVYIVGAISYDVKLGTSAITKKTGLTVGYNHVLAYTTNGGSASFFSETATLNINTDYANDQYAAGTGSVSGTAAKTFGDIKIYKKAYSGTVTTNKTSADIKVGGVAKNGSTSYTISDIPSGTTRAVYAAPYVGYTGSSFVDVGTISDASETSKTVGPINYYPVSFTGTGGVQMFFGSTQIDNGTNVLSGQSVSFKAETFKDSGVYVDYGSARTVSSSGVDISVPYHQVSFGGQGEVRATCGGKPITSGKYVLQGQTVSYTAETFAGSDNYVASGSSPNITSTINQTIPYHTVTFGGTNGGTVRAFLGTSSSGVRLTPSPKYVLQGQSVYFDAETFAGSEVYVNKGSVTVNTAQSKNLAYYPVSFSGTGTDGTGSYGTVKATCGTAIDSGTYVLDGQTVSFEAETYAGSGTFKDQPAKTVNSSVNNNIPYYSVKYQPVGSGGTGHLGIVNAYCGSTTVIPTQTYVLHNETVTYKAESFAGSNNYVASGSSNNITANIDKDFRYWPVTFSSNNTSYGTVTANCGAAITTGKYVLNGQKVDFTATATAGDTSYIQSINNNGVNSGFVIANLKGTTLNDVTVDAAKDYSVTFGNWEAELNDELTAATTPVDKAGVLYKYFDGTDNGTTDNYRAILNGLFTLMPGVMTSYDSVNDKYSVIEQYLAKMEAEGTTSASGAAAEITADFRLGGGSDFAKMVAAQLKLQETAAQPAVSVNNTTGELTITAPITDVNYNTVLVGSTSLTKTDGTTWTYTLTPADISAGYVIITCTDTNGYTVKEKYTVTKTDFSVEQITAAPTPAVGGEMGIAVKPGADTDTDATRDNGNRTIAIYSLSDPRYEYSSATLEKTWHTTTSLNDGPAVLTVNANQNGAYFKGFVKGGNTTVMLTEAQAKAVLGSDATLIENRNSSTDPADWTYTLKYVPAGVTAVTAQYRNLLGEVNLAADNAQLKSVIDDENYSVVMHGGDGKTIDAANGDKTTTTITGDIAKNTFNALNNTPSTTEDMAAVLEKLYTAVTERGGSDGYTIAEFNNALYYSSKLQKAIDEAEAKAREVYTTGSWTELQSVLSAVKTEWDAADGTPEITTERIAVLYSQMQRALNQLIDKTLAVEIVTNADGVNNTVTFDATNPAQAGVPAKDGQNGYAFPVYGSDVTLAVTAGTDYNVAYKLDGAASDRTSVNAALTNVTAHHKVEIRFTKQTVAFTDHNGGSEQVNKGEALTRTLTPGAGKIIIPGGTVRYTVDGTAKTVIVDASGRFTIPAADVTGNIVITDVSGAVGAPDKTALTMLLDLADDYDAGADKTYGSDDYTYTQESWKALLGVGGAEYGGAYGDAIKVKDNDKATPAQIKAACDKLGAAIGNLKKQYPVTLSSGFTVADGQAGVAKLGGNYYVADGGSVALNVTLDTGKKLNKVTYKMGTEDYTAWEAGGKVTLYGVTGPITNLTADTSDKGFSVIPVSGGIGAAIGTMPDGKTYVLTPETGNELVSITVDGVKSAVPNTGELEGVVSAAFEGVWTKNKKTVSVNGRGVVFSQVMAGDPPAPTDKITATLPGIGEVSFTVSGDIVTVTVIKAGSLGYAPGSKIDITTSGTPDYNITDVKLTPPGAGYTVDFGTPADGASVTWGGENSGNHGVTAITTLKTYTVTVGGGTAAPVGGVTASAATVKHGGSVTLTIPAPADKDKEVAMTSTLTAQVGTKTYTAAPLTDLAAARYAVNIQSDGSAKVVLNGIDGAVSITGADIKTTTKGTVSGADKLQQDKNNFTGLLDKLQKAIEAADTVIRNDGKIYDDAATDALEAKLNEKKTLEDKLDDLDSTELAAITDEGKLIEELKKKLNVTGDKTIEQLLDIIETAVDELTEETNNTKKNIADGVISVTTGGTPAIGLDPVPVVAGKLNPDGTGSDLVINNIKTEPGYLPIVNIVVGGEKKPFKILEKIPTGYEAVEPIYDKDGNITGWEPDANDKITVTGAIDPTTKTGDFSIKIENGDIIGVLGKDTDKDGRNDNMGDITAATTEGYLTGRKLPTAEKLYEDTFVSAATKGIIQIDIDVNRDGTADFKAGATEQDKAIVPVVVNNGAAAISVTYTVDTYTKGGNTWYKGFTGVTLGGLFYPADHMPAGISFAPTTDATLARKTGGTLTINTTQYTGELSGLKLSFEPTNSQFTTWRNELNQAEIELNEVLRRSVDLTGVDDKALLAELGIADIKKMKPGEPYYNVLYPSGGTALAGTALTAKLKELIIEKRVSKTELSDVNAKELQEVVKLINRLVDQAKGDPATSEYFLTQENKDYHATDIEQLKQLQQRLDQLLTVKNIYDDIEALYKKATETAGLKLPVASPISAEQKGVVLSVTGEIAQLELEWDALSEKERLLVGEPATKHINELTDAVTLARESGMTEEELFRSRVIGIRDLIKDTEPYTITDPDKVADMITQAETQYYAMTNEQRAAVYDSKLLLDELKGKLDKHLEDKAKDFAKKWLTTAYTGTSDAEGGIDFSSSTNRLDSDKAKPGYAHRVSLANTNYNALPTCVKAVVDKIFFSPTVPNLYGDTFKAVKNISGLTDKELADAFIADYLTQGGGTIKSATYTNYDKLLEAETPWNNLAPTVRSLVNEKLGVNATNMIDAAKAIDKNLTAAQSFISSYLRYDGSVVTVGNSTTRATITAAKSAWDRLSTAVQEAVNYKLVNTYMGKTYPDLYSAVSGGGGSTSSKVPVVVDGVKYNIGQSVTVGKVTTVTVDQTELKKQLATAKETVVIPVSRGENVNTVTAQLVVANVNEMAQKEMTLSVQVDEVIYDMPAVAIDTSKLMTELGASDPEKVPVNVTITALTKDDVTLESGELMLPPVQFTVTASYGGRNVEVEVFQKFVQRVIEIPSDADAKKITTAVVVENGKQRHVPTEVFQKDGKWFARVNSLTNSAYALIWNEAGFTDDDGMWFEAIVTEMASRSVINGRAEGVFAGDANITRAEFAAILIRALGLPENGDASVFGDVLNSEWYYGAVGKAYEYGLINGRGEGLFVPGANITRQEAMAMVHRAASITELAGTVGSLSAFADPESISDWALADAQWNVGSGLISGNDKGELNGQNNITRAESATIILRLLQKSDLVDVRTEA